MRVEAVRIGTITAQDKKAADAWQRERDKMSQRKSGGLTGASLESAIARIAQGAPDLVIVKQDA